MLPQTILQKPNVFGCFVCVVRIHVLVERRAHLRMLKSFPPIKLKALYVVVSRVLSLENVLLCVF